MKLRSKATFAADSVVCIDGTFLLTATEEERAVTFCKGRHRQRGPRPSARADRHRAGGATEMFGRAFGCVRPAKGSGPSGDETRNNKEVRSKAIGPRGVANERPDEATRCHQFRPQNGELWTHFGAKARRSSRAAR